jgi:hypothetical protein
MREPRDDPDLAQEAASSARITLIATWRPYFRSSARYTVAMPPRPSSRSIANRSSSDEGRLMVGSGISR